MIKALRRTGVVLICAALAVGIAAAPASAHATTTPNTAETANFSTAIRVGHTCEGSSPMTAIRVRIPEGVTLVRPEEVAGWDLEVTRAGASPLGPVVEVAWVGGLLPDHTVQLFPLSFRITRQAPDVLWFVTIQECEVGELRWEQIPPSVDEWGTVPRPAPYVINSVW